MIDQHVMSHIVGLPVVRSEFKLEEDLNRPLCDGVTWRRRRFRFRVESDGSEDGALEGLCINELTIDSNAAAELSPALAADFPHLVDMDEIENAYWQTTWAGDALRSSSGEKQSRLFVNMGSPFYSEPGLDHRPVIQSLRTVQELDSPDDKAILGLGALDPRLIDMEDGEFDTVRWLPAFPPSRIVQSYADVLAATNAGYFLNFPEEYNDTVSALHQPLGGHIIEGRLVMPPWVSRPGLMVFENKQMDASVFGPEMLEVRIGNLPPVPLHVGHFADDPNGMVWRYFDADEFAPPPDAVELIFSGTMLVDVGHARSNVTPPKGGAVVWLTGDHAKAALHPDGIRQISLGLRSHPMGKPKWMVTGGPFLVRDGIRITKDFLFIKENTGDFQPSGPAPTRFPFDPLTTRAPRTAIGTTSSGGWKVVVVDGRRSGEHSIGITLDGLSRLMEVVGCETAVNLDGGGSSVLAIEGATHSDALSEHCAYGVVNIPSDENAKERVVPIMMTVKSKA